MPADGSHYETMPADGSHYETMPGDQAGEEGEPGYEDPLYDSVPAKIPGRKVSTEVDGFFNQFPAPMRTRTQAYSIVRPKATDTNRQRKESYEMVTVKQAKLSTDTNTTPDKPVKYIEVHRDKVLQEEDEIYDAPSLNKQSEHSEETYSDIYFAPSLQKPTPSEPPGPKPPARPVPQLPGHPGHPSQLPGHPSRPPPPAPRPAIPPRHEPSSSGQVYVVQDPDRKLIDNGE
jgi:hypothetical protein